MRLCCCHWCSCFSLPTSQPASLPTTGTITHAYTHNYSSTKSNAGATPAKPPHLGIGISIDDMLLARGTPREALAFSSPAPTGSPNSRHINPHIHSLLSFRYLAPRKTTRSTAHTNRAGGEKMMRGRRAPCPSFVSIGTRLTMLHRSLACKIWVSFLVLLLCACVGGRKDESGCRGTASKGHTGHGIPLSSSSARTRGEAGGSEHEWWSRALLATDTTARAASHTNKHTCPLWSCVSTPYVSRSGTHTQAQWWWSSCGSACERPTKAVV